MQLPAYGDDNGAQSTTQAERIFGRDPEVGGWATRERLTGEHALIYVTKVQRVLGQNRPGRRDDPVYGKLQCILIIQQAGAYSIRPQSPIRLLVFINSDAKNVHDRILCRLIPSFSLLSFILKYCSRLTPATAGFYGFGRVTNFYTLQFPIDSNLISDTHLERLSVDFLQAIIQVKS